MSLDLKLEKLAAYEPNGFPFISLYLNTQADQHGRDDFDRFVRKEFRNRAKTFANDSPERESFERDAGRISLYLRDKLKPSANGLAVFACAGANNYFKAIQLDAPIDKHAMHVSQGPHLYPLARLIDQYPRYVALIADTNSARLFVFGLGKTESTEELSNFNTSRTLLGERPQLRYQQRLDNYRAHYIKEVAQMLERVVRDENAEHIVLAGDEIFIPLLREQIPPYLTDKVIDVLRLDIRTPEHEVLKATTESLRDNNIQTDAEKVRDLLDKYREGGLAVVGLRDTLDALTNGQVDELILTASLKEISVDQKTLSRIPSISAPPNTLAGSLGEPRSTAAAADMLVARTLSTGAAVTFIEDTILLSDLGGVGAFLRYRN
ncbi:MAG TPA: Vms1/Ankzf1 family peptidyl-tRNA hydrolase [Pyrinomonadaceae bacterium]|nr:Vms1/Ankzf1 family peptidyl-tRNA hydrolase [Pyrinomonadaceae bacterium]